MFSEVVFQLVAPRVERLDVGYVRGDREAEVGGEGGWGPARAELDGHPGGRCDRIWDL